MKKTASINIMISEEDKKRLSDKSKQMGLSLTSYIEKVSREPVIFLDINSRTLLEALKLNSTM